MAEIAIQHAKATMPEACRVYRKITGDGGSVSHPGAATCASDHADPVTFVETFTATRFLHDGHPASTVVEADFDFQSAAAGDTLADVRANRTTGKRTANRCSSATGASADLVSGEPSDTGTDERATE